MPDGESTGTFRPLDQGERCLHGRPAILVSGHPPEELARLREALSAAGLDDVPIIPARKKDGPRSLGQLVAQPSAADPREPGLATRAVVVSGVPEARLASIMRAHRAAGLAQTLWAGQTPTNAAWPLQTLLAELTREREALGQALRSAPTASPAPPPPPA